MLRKQKKNGNKVKRLKTLLCVIPGKAQGNGSKMCCLMKEELSRTKLHF